MAHFYLLRNLLMALFLILQMKSEAQSLHQIKVGNKSYRDLNKNGKLDVYEDARQPIEKRIDDLISQMTIEEKAGCLFINFSFINDDGSLDRKLGSSPMIAEFPDAATYLNQLKITHINYLTLPNAKITATSMNTIQKMAEATRLGIPVSFASDPRHGYDSNIFQISGTEFSTWPEPIGLAAINDEKLTQLFGDIARQEYTAVGFRIALHPQADLTTEPRWARISGTFGEDAQLSARMVNAYIRGFQGEKLGATSVACMTKHFSGGGPQKEGLDPHFDFQKGQVYPGNNFNYHLIPFKAAFAAHTASIMPYYGVPMNQTSENVGFGFNKDIITKLLRDSFKFEGVVCTDWGLVTDRMGGIWPARAWGVEKLNYEQRVEKIINAGCDQMGGENIPEVVVALVKSGKITEARINTSVRRILRQKFELGLFENPYVNIENVNKVVGRIDFKAAGEAAQRRSFTLLKNEGQVLPLKKSGLKIYLKNVDSTVASKYATVVNAPEKADFAIIRLKTPFYPVASNNPVVAGFQHGDLDFKGKELEDILSLLKKVPTIVDIYLSRPAVIPEISGASKALLANFGSSDAALLDIVFGKSKPGGKLPFELPSSMQAVNEQKEDVPYDSKNPLYKFGFGLSY